MVSEDMKEDEDGEEEDGDGDRGGGGTRRSLCQTQGRAPGSGLRRGT